MFSLVDLTLHPPTPKYRSSDDVHAHTTKNNNNNSFITEPKPSRAEVLAPAAGLWERFMSQSNRQAVEDFIKNPTTEIGLAFIVLASCVLFIFSTLDGTSGGQAGGINLGAPILSAIEVAEQAIGLIFLLEYIARWYYTGM